MGATMILTEKHVQILRDIHHYAKIKRYHGLMPRKLTLFYDEGLLESLLESGLVKEGIIQTTCGSNPEGYRLSKKGKCDLKELGIDLRTDEWKVLQSDSVVHLDDLEEGDIEVLMDIYHLTQLKHYGGMAPQYIMENYSSSQLKALYDLGYILYIKLKGAEISSEKGYVLSEKAHKLLRQVGFNA